MLKSGTDFPICVISTSLVFKEWIQSYFESKKQVNYILSDSLTDQIDMDKYNIFIFDIHNSYMNAINILAQIKKMNPNKKIITVLEGISDLYLNMIFKSKIDALVAVSELDKDLLKKVMDDVSKKQIFISHQFKDKILENIRLEQTHRSLTYRELQIISFLGSGKSAVEISELLHCSPKTINVHRANIKEKLGIKKNQEFMQYCFKSVN